MFMEFGFVAGLIVVRSATRAVRLTGASLGQFGGTRLESSMSHSVVREKVGQLESAAPGEKLFSFSPAVTAAIATVHACAFLFRALGPYRLRDSLGFGHAAVKVNKLTADTHLARTHVRIPNTDAEAVITRIRDTLEKYGAAVQTNNEKGKVNGAPFRLFLLDWTKSCLCVCFSCLFRCTHFKVVARSWCSCTPHRLRWLWS
jgi:hypothetical protein